MIIRIVPRLMMVVELGMGQALSPASMRGAGSDEVESQRFGGHGVGVINNTCVVMPTANCCHYRLRSHGAVQHFPCWLIDRADYVDGERVVAVVKVGSSPSAFV